jgi:predicted aspartyl protease
VLALLATAGHAGASPAGDPVPLAVAAQPVGCGIGRVGAIAITIAERTPIVTVAANGVPLSLVLDTGAERTILTPAAAERVKGEPPRIAFQRQVRGLAGTAPSREVELRSFAAGAAAFSWRRLVVAPLTLAATTVPLDGLLGADALADFDLDLDLPRQRVAFYRKQACRNAAPDWAPPYTAIETGRSRGEHLFFPVRLDGREMTAFVDTGAQRSAVSAEAAGVLGVTGATLARDPRWHLHGATAGRVAGHLHRFASLQVGREAIGNPELVIAKLGLADADIILGFDFILPRRLWLSYGARRIFLPGR